MFGFHHQDVLTFNEITLALATYESNVGAKSRTAEGMFGFARFYYAGRLGRFAGITGEEAKARQSAALLACVTVCNLPASENAETALQEADLLLDASATPYEVKGRITLLGVLAGLFHAEGIRLRRISISRLMNAKKKMRTPLPDATILGF